MYLWPEEFFQDGDHDAHLDSDFQYFVVTQIFVLEGEPGDVIYWPSGYWHVGESVGGLSISLSLALKPLQPSSEVVDHLKQYIEEFVTASLDESHFPTTPEQLEESAALISEVTKLALKALQKASRDSDFAQAIQVSWLDRLTASGAIRAAAVAVENLADDAFVQGSPEYPILWIPVSQTTISHAQRTVTRLPFRRTRRSSSCWSD